MKRIIIVLAILLLFSIPCTTLAEQAQKPHTIWNIPWKCTEDEFIRLASENAHADFKRKAESILSSVSDGISFLGQDVESVDANFHKNEFAFAFIYFPEQTAAIYDIKQLKDAIELCVQDVRDKWNALTKEYGSFTSMGFFLMTEKAPSPVYQVPMLEGAPDWDAIRSIIWDAIHVSDELDMEIQWDNMEYILRIYCGIMRPSVSFRSHVSSKSLISHWLSKELLDYKLQYEPGFKPPEIKGFEHTVYQDDISIRIRVPDYMNVYEVGRKKGSTSLADVGDMELPILGGAKAVLYATDETVSKEIMVIAADIPQADENPYEVLFENISPDLELYTTKQAKFVRAYIDTDKDEKTPRDLAYITLYGGKAIWIIYASHEEKISPADESLMEGIAESIAFGDAPGEPGTGTAAGEAYTDIITKATFVIPAGWTKNNSSMIDGQLMIEFVQDEPAESIVYASEDGWAISSEERKAGHTRVEYNNAHWTKAEIAAKYGLTEDKVSTVQYNGTEYFKLMVDDPKLLPEDYKGECMIRLHHMENGYMHIFAFLGEESSANYIDFEALLNSVEYAGTGAGS